MPLADSERREFADMLTHVAALYQRELTAPVISIYWQALAPYDLAAVRHALHLHVVNPDTGQFWPKPADLIKLVSGSTQDAAMAAWALVLRSIQSIGGYEDVKFSDPLIAKAIEAMGGWVKLCEGQESDLPYRAKDFTTLYRGFALRRDAAGAPPHLTGRFSQQNRALGYAPAPPVLADDLLRPRTPLVTVDDGQTT